MRISTSFQQQQGIGRITDLSAQASQTQLRIASGRRILSPADDPAGAATIVRLNQQLAARQRYIENADRAEIALQQEETILGGITDSLQRVRELTLQAGDPAFTEVDRAYLGAELRVRFEEILDLVNSRDADGQYLFSGFRGEQRPFDFENGTVRYQGDSGQRELALGPDQLLAVSDSGQSLFAGAAVDFPTVRVASDVDVGGTPLLSARVSDAALLSASGVRRIAVEVREVSGATVLDFVNADDGTAIPGATTVPYGPNVAIPEAGLNLSFADTPAVGDRFVLEVSQQQGLLTTINNIAEALNGDGAVPATGDAGVETLVAQTLTGIDRALDNILSTQASLGARLNAIDSTRTLNEEVVLQTQEQLSDVRDIDFAEAVSDLNFQSFVLEAAQQSFIRVSRLSLFNSL